MLERLILFFVYFSFFSKKMIRKRKRISKLPRWVPQDILELLNSTLHIQDVALLVCCYLKPWMVVPNLFLLGSHVPVYRSLETFPKSQLRDNHANLTFAQTLHILGSKLPRLLHFQKFSANDKVNRWCENRMDDWSSLFGIQRKSVVLVHALAATTSRLGEISESTLSGYKIFVAGKLMLQLWSKCVFEFDVKTSLQYLTRLGVLMMNTATIYGAVWLRFIHFICFFRHPNNFNSGSIFTINQRRLGNRNGVPSSCSICQASR